MTRKEMLYHDLTYDHDPALHCSADMREWLTKFSGKLARAGPATITTETETTTEKEPI